MNSNAICWFEIYVDDLERAKKFYSEVIGTSFTDIPAEGDNFAMSLFAAPDNEGVNGALVKMGSEPRTPNPSPSTMVYFPCEDAEIEESRVEKAGGIVTTPKMSIGEFGFCSMCLDTEGNAFGLYSMK